VTRYPHGLLKKRGLVRDAWRIVDTWGYNLCVCIHEGTPLPKCMQPILYMHVVMYVSMYVVYA